MPDKLSLDTNETNIPLITIICFGRNDDFHINYLERTSYCLHYNLHSIYLAGLIGKVRYLFVDFGSAERISDNIEFPEKFRNSIDFLNITPQELSANNISQSLLPYGLILNTAFGVSKSQFVFWGASDLIGSQDSFKAVYDYCKTVSVSRADELLIIERVFMKRTYLRHERTFEEVHSYLANAVFEPQIISGCGGGGAYIGARSDFIDSIGGLSHGLIPAGRTEPDIELFVRSSSRASFKNLSKKMGAYFFKLPYSAQGARIRIMKSSKNRWLGRVLETDIKHSQCNVILGTLTKPFFSSSSQLENLMLTLPGESAVESARFLTFIFRSWSSIAHARDVLALLHALEGYRGSLVILRGNFHYSLPLACAVKLGFGTIFWFYGRLSSLHVPTFMNYARLESSNLASMEDSFAFNGSLRCERDTGNFDITGDYVKFFSGEKCFIVIRDRKEIKIATVDVNELIKANRSKGLVSNDTPFHRLTFPRISLSFVAKVAYAIVINYIKRKLNVK